VAPADAHLDAGRTVPSRTHAQLDESCFRCRIIFTFTDHLGWQTIASLLGRLVGAAGGELEFCCETALKSGSAEGVGRASRWIKHACATIIAIKVTVWEKLSRFFSTDEI
jgi:hypothetical protein